jgi:hypothetical protein
MICDAPESLSEPERAIWRNIVSKVRPGWFYSSEALLRAYVGTVAQLETLARRLAQEEPCSARYFKILRLQLSVTKVAASLATKLRLTPRSTFDRYQPKTVPNLKKPWEV